MFLDKFWLNLLLTIPVVLYSPSIQELLKFSMPEFPGSTWIPFVFGSAIFFSGGLVFLKSAWGELKARLPGMMTLIALAITAAYVYSLAVTFGLEGMEFFWELATLITIMLLGHWLEMRSVSAAQGALQSAGVRVAMVTGDAKDVAQSVAKQLGSLQPQRLSQNFGKRDDREEDLGLKLMNGGKHGLRRWVIVCSLLNQGNENVGVDTDTSVFADKSFSGGHLGVHAYR